MPFVIKDGRYFSSTDENLVQSKIKIQANGISSNVAFSLSVAVTKINLLVLQGNRILQPVSYQNKKTGSL